MAKVKILNEKEVKEHNEKTKYLELKKQTDKKKNSFWN
jgi:hypothetical protein